MKTMIIYFEGTAYTIPCDERGNPVSQFTLPDGSLVSVGRWRESSPPQVGDYKRDALGAPVAMPVAHMKSVQMVTTRDEDGVNEISVMVDGAVVGGGRIGGEPEDNCEYRDYSWIRPLVRDMAGAFGANLKETIVKEEDEDEDG